jgi:hypothetical protein
MNKCRLLQYIMAISLLNYAFACNTHTTIVTFQPGGVTDVCAGVFADFGQLCNYIATIGNETDRWTIQIDGSFTGGSPSINTGTYSIPQSVKFIGLANAANPGNYPTLSGDSVVFSPPPVELYFTNLPFITFNNFPIVPLVTVNQTLYVHLTDCILESFSPFFAAVNGGFIVVRLYSFASLGTPGSPGSIILTVDGTSTASVTAFDGGSIVADAATVSPGGVLRIHIVDSAQLDPSYLTLSGVTVDFRSLASQINGLQSGTTTLVHGVSPAILVSSLTSTSRIVATYSNTMGSTKLGVLIAKTSDRVFGTPGSFKIRSLTHALAPVTGDKSSVEWHVVDTNN